MQTAAPTECLDTVRSGSMCPRTAVDVARAWTAERSIRLQISIQAVRPVVPPLARALLQVPSFRRPADFPPMDIVTFHRNRLLSSSSRCLAASARDIRSRAM